ncbi:hypothetical protein [Rhodococcus sp. 11-3]|uniref:hypothetical protein n=1 Tax=Rhodococcus sp. 11-3 TaxID=2854796 RepID=UPI00203D8347|nr:hypothetical protein [Rhodococcus sp. 11-3]
MPLDYDLGEAANVLAQGCQCGAVFEDLGESATVGVGETVGSGGQPPGDLPGGWRRRWCRPRPERSTQWCRKPADGLGVASVTTLGDLCGQAGGVGASRGEAVMQVGFVFAEQGGSCRPGGGQQFVEAMGTGEAADGLAVEVQFPADR